MPLLLAFILSLSSLSFASDASPLRNLFCEAPIVGSIEPDNVELTSLASHAMRQLDGLKIHIDFVSSDKPLDQVMAFERTAEDLLEITRAIPTDSEAPPLSLRARYRARQAGSARLESLELQFNLSGVIYSLPLALDNMSGDQELLLHFQEDFLGQRIRRKASQPRASNSRYISLPREFSGEVLEELMSSEVLPVSVAQTQRRKAPERVVRGGAWKWILPAFAIMAGLTYSSPGDKPLDRSVYEDTRSSLVGRPTPSLAENEKAETIGRLEFTQDGRVLFHTLDGSKSFSLEDVRALTTSGGQSFKVGF
jgi:hypothetical protein